MIDIFCPQCEALILDRDTCPECRWRRHTATGALGVVIWQADLRTKLNKPYCYPAIAAGLYCLGTEDGNVLALDVTTGEVVWEYALAPGTLAHAVATDGQAFYIGGEDVNSIPRPGRALLALDAASGEVLWESPTQAHSLSGAVVSGDTVLFTATDGMLRAVAAHDGSVIWAVSHPRWGPTPPQICGDTVCVGGRGDTLVAYALATGDVRWRHDGTAWFAHPLTADAATVYAMAWDGHLYALDAVDGTVRWEAVGERARGFTTPPAVASNTEARDDEGLVLIGSRLYRGEGEGRSSGYGLLALDATSGDERWRCYVEKHIHTPPTIIADQVFFGSDNGHLYSADLADGTIIWQVQATSRAVTLPQACGDLVIFGGRDGMVHAVRSRAAPAEALLAPEAYLSQGAYADAAAAFALQRQFTRAAQLYAEHVQALDKAVKLYQAGDQPDKAAELLMRLERFKEAAALYEEAGERAHAAGAWEQAGAFRRARSLYQELKDQSGLARVLEHLGDYLEAARIQNGLGNLEDAARLFALGGDHVSEAEVYKKLKKWDKVAGILAQLEEWEDLVRLYLNQGKKLDAARVLETHDQIARARDLYKEAGAIAEAMRMSIRLQDWDAVARAAESLNDYAQAAAAWERIPDYELAAAAYVQAGKRAMDERPVDDTRVATYYERASKLYDQRVYDEEKARACWHMVTRYRHIPDLRIQVTSDRGFVEGQYNLLTVTVLNKGGGVALNVRIRAGEGFDVRDHSPIRYLPAGGRREVKLGMRPHRGKGYVGENVPLGIVVTYEDSARESGELFSQVFVKVAESRVAESGFSGVLGAATPINIHIQTLNQNSTQVDGDYMEGGANKAQGDIMGDGSQKAEGDILNDGAQKGDRVDISRGAAPAGGDAGPRVTVREGVGPVRRCPICNVPTSDSSVRYCSECGAPLLPADDDTRSDP